MTLPIHPRWGLAIGFYEPFCNLIRSGVSSNSKIAGLQAMQKISRLASERRIPAQRELGKDIYMSTLQAALHLAMDPMTIAHLADPPVISGCIQLMKGVIGESRGVASPFTYEYGSLCFELLVCAVNICLMQRWGKLDEAYAQYLETGGHNPELAPYLWASVGLSSVVQQQFEILKNGGDCDWVLGWPTSTSHPRQTPLVALSDVSTLLELLWNDRKHFSTAMARCYPAAFGLSGLLFIFSRYIAIK
ncbi:hypothetical protein FRC11_002782 [Ceratobasidium sp. 423]|nr:hypothetical protein FRC11_002782 [Ceratobasidium sp. 423]